MVKYVKIYNEFCNFIRNEGMTNFSDNELKLIKLISDNFDRIAEVGTKQGKRAILLNQLIQKHGSDISSQFDITDSSEASTEFPFDYLNFIELENFRGFSSYEKIEFSKNYTFIYGPNGSGKSSLCEALEYAMLGYINEAISKRITIENYIRNNVTGKINYPILNGDKDCKQLVINPNPSLYHFCFLEKSRIENFARISANTPSEQNNLLSILFGLIEFDNFVHEFTENIENYIDINGKKSLELSSKLSSIKVHRSNVKKAKDELAKIKKAKNTLQKQSNLKMSFNKLSNYLHGSDGKPGHISEIDTELNKPISHCFEVPTCEELGKLKLEINKNAKEYKSFFSEFTAKKDSVNFRDLFNLVLEIEPLSKEKCPVCETPVEVTIKHPYKNAKQKLSELQHIAELEEKLENAKNILITNLKSFQSKIDQRIKISTEFVLSKPLTVIEIEDLDFDKNILDTSTCILKNYTDDKKPNLDLDSNIKSHNKAAKNEQKKREELIAEKELLSKLSGEIKSLMTLETTTSENLNTWNSAIDEFVEENKNLIIHVKEEEKQIKINKEFVSAYQSLLKKLKVYKAKLPHKHLSKLNDLTVEFYNDINYHDRTFEIINELKLPSKPELPIQVSFKNEPSKFHDALQILSEGHIRCLGLSILLAKNVHEKHPFIIFDDVVNAIDDDHRGGVRKLIFENNKLNKKQIILTSHASHFISELEQYPSRKEYSDLVNKMTFLPDSEQRKIRIKLDDSKNYIIKSEQLYSEFDYNEALYYCRCALENISHRLWRKLSNKKYKTEFSVVLRQPNAVPDLMSVINSLNKFLKKIDQGNEYKTINDVFDYLIGLDKINNVIWNYLNKGTHEEENKPEFDQLIVLEIIQKIKVLDETIK